MSKDFTTPKRKRDEEATDEEIADAVFNERKLRHMIKSQRKVLAMTEAKLAKIRPVALKGLNAEFCTAIKTYIASEFEQDTYTLAVDNFDEPDEHEFVRIHVSVGSLGEEFTRDIVAGSLGYIQNLVEQWKAGIEQFVSSKYDVADVIDALDVSVSAALMRSYYTPVRDHFTAGVQLVTWILRGSASEVQMGTR